jgi:hypothetical protein
MTEVIQLLETLRQLLPILSEHYQVESLCIFGSYVRQEQKPESDLDILITFFEPPSLIKFIEIENFLTDRLGIKVDLVMRDALKPRISKIVMQELIEV